MIVLVHVESSRTFISFLSDVFESKLTRGRVRRGWLEI